MGQAGPAAPAAPPPQVPPHRLVQPLCHVHMPQVPPPQQPPVPPLNIPPCIPALPPTSQYSPQPQIPPSQYKPVPPRESQYGPDLPHDFQHGPQPHTSMVQCPMTPRMIHSAPVPPSMAQGTIPVTPSASQSPQWHTQTGAPAGGCLPPPHPHWGPATGWGLLVTSLAVPCKVTPHEITPAVACHPVSPCIVSPCIVSRLPTGCLNLGHQTPGARPLPRCDVMQCCVMSHPMTSPLLQRVILCHHVSSVCVCPSLGLGPFGNPGSPPLPGVMSREVV